MVDSHGKHTVFVDMDETLYDMSGHWFKLYNERYDDDLDPKDVDVWDVADLDRKLKCSVDEILQIFHEEGFFYDLHPYPFASEAIRAVEEAFPVRHVILTHANTRTGAYDKMRAIERDFPFLGFNRFLLTGGSKNLAPGLALIDDRPKYLEEFAETYPDAFTVVFDQNYNKDVKTDHRMNDWSQYYSLVEEMIDAYETCFSCGR